MIHMKTVIVPEKTESKEDYRTCDVCGKTIRPKDYYSIDEVEIYHETGSCYPEGTDAEKETWDICGECFFMKIKPLVVSIAGEPRREYR